MDIQGNIKRTSQNQDKFRLRHYKMFDEATYFGCEIHQRWAAMPDQTTSTKPNGQAP
jgi:hypothetical protein